jgi:hypothetical protein
MTEYVRGSGRTIAANFTRPNDSTDYAAGDVVSDSASAGVPMTFARATDGSGEHAIIQQAIIVTSAAVATKPDLELWLFDTTVASVNDNAAIAFTDAEMRTLIGVIKFPTADFLVGIPTAGAAGNAVCDVQNIGMPFNTKPGKNEIYGVLVVRNAYDPVANERFDIRLKILD